MRKAQFESPLWASRVPAKDQTRAGGWRLEKELRFWSPTFGYIVVPLGYVTDFASVPRLPLSYLFFGDVVHAAAVVHDYLISHHYAACRISWRHAADIFNEAMVADSVPAWRRIPMYRAVRIFGLCKIKRCRA